MSKPIDIQSLLPSGRYVVAVSGGVDSMVLLDLLANAPGYKVVVAHLDHGWRADSGVDAAMVQQVAAAHEVPVVVARLMLDKRDEASARQARYTALRHIAAQHQVDGIVLGHHLDDHIETSVMSLSRGGDRHAAVPMRPARDGLLRPLLTVPKSDIMAHAQKHGLKWHEDSSNQDVRYRRNWIRQVGLQRLRRGEPRFDTIYADGMRQLGDLNPRMDVWLDQLLDEQAVAVERHTLSFDRQWLRQRSPRLRRHLLAAAWQRLAPAGQLRRERVEGLSRAVASDRSKALMHLGGALNATLTYDRVTLTRADLQEAVQSSNQSRDISPA